MWLNILTNVCAVLFGGLITWVVSKHYYVKGTKHFLKRSDELIAESKQLRRLSEILLHVMEDAGFVKLNRDGNEIIGRIVDTRKPLPPGGCSVDKGDIIQYADKYVEILRPNDKRVLAQNAKRQQSNENVGPAASGKIKRGPITVKS